MFTPAFTSPFFLHFIFFSWLVILLLLVYMGLVVVLLLNVLIAQLSCTYEEAKSCAKLQYTADTMKIIARLEQSCITSFIDVSEHF